jgi:hypothetical protein
MARERNSEIICDPINHRRTGIDLHTFRIDKRFAGAKISNVRLMGYDKTTCPHANSIKFDTHVSTDRIAM